MKFENVYFINGSAFAGKSTMVHLLAEKYDGIECGENYHDQLPEQLDPREFPGLTYTRDLLTGMISSEDLHRNTLTGSIRSLKNARYWS